MTTNKFTSNNNPMLVAASSSDGETPVYLYADPSTHGLVVSATISSVGLATSTIQTDGTQKTQIVGPTGTAVTVTGGKLDVNATASLAGSALPISGATTAVGVGIVDGSGNQITSFGGGTQYAEGATTTPATGTVALARYQATPATITDGKLTAPLTDATSKLIVVTSGTTTISGSVTANIGTTNGLALDATLTGGNQQVQGNVADAGTDSGNPIKIGGVNKTTPTTLASGQRGDINLDTRENLKVSLWAPNSNTAYTFGNGVTGAGSQRVTIASDNTAFSVNSIQSGTWSVGASTATGSAVPANAHYLGVNDFGTGNLVGVRGMANATNSTGGGILASGNMAQFDDVSPTAITENSFGNLRMSANRNAYSTIRDAAGNERGANVTASNALVVDGSAVTQPVSGSVTVNAGTNLNTSALALETGGNLATIASNIPTKGLALPAQTDYFMPTMQVPQKTWRNGFDRTFASGFDTVWMTTLVTGSGMTVAQSGGSAVITTGTTANSETIGRSLISFDGSLTLRYSMNLSQRIANQQFFVEMVDVIGDSLTLLVNSATSITVTIPSNPFTSANVGQSMYVGNITGVASAIPGRYTIASVSGNNVTFTVASWPASGSGTVSLFGWNYHHIIYDATTATSCTFDSQRNGWNSGETTATINTTASPGHVGVYGVTDGKTVFSDQLSASSTTLELTQRGSRVRNVPIDGTALYVQIRALNGSSAPATTTTWTLGFAEVDNFILSQMSLNNIVPQSANSALPTQILNTPNIGTVTTLTGTTALTPGVAATNLGKAEDAASVSGDTGVFTLGIRRDGAITTSPTSAVADYSEFAVDNYGQIRTAVQARTTNPTAAADGNGSIIMSDKLGKQIVVGSIRDLKANTITTITASTAETTIVASVASVFVDLYGLIITNTSATAVNVAIKDATAGTTRLNVAVPAGDTRGFMLPEGGAIKQAAVTNNWTATSSASITSLIITALTVQNL